MQALLDKPTNDHRGSWQELLQWPVRDLAALLASETKKFLAKQPHDDRVGLALFALAIIQRNQEAWNCLYEQYRPLMLNWLKRSPQAMHLMHDGEDPTFLIDSAFVRFFQSMSEAKFKNFSNLGGLLRYLQLCTRCVVSDCVRRDRANLNESTLDEVENDLVAEDTADGVLAVMQTRQFWRAIDEALPNPDERWLVRQIFVRGMKPSEISHDAPDIFPTAQDVYRVRINILERLRRNKKLQRELGSLTGREAMAL